MCADHDSMYGGRVFGELHSSVRAHIDESGVLTASIVLPDETYHIEVRDFIQISCFNKFK